MEQISHRYEGPTVATKHACEGSVTERRASAEIVKPGEAHIDKCGPLCTLNVVS